MKVAHTPGPWVAQLHERGAFDICTDDSPNKAVTLCSRYDWMERSEEMHANARQMAAAPYLLGALDDPMLRQLLGEIEDSGTPEAQKLWAYAMAWFDVKDAAIAKATGAAA